MERDAPRRRDTVDEERGGVRLGDAATDAPIYWQADVRSIIEANGKALLANAAPRLGDWPAGGDDAGCARLLREETTQLATLCEVWPALWAHARDQGERLLGAV